MRKVENPHRLGKMIGGKALYPLRAIINGHNLSRVRQATTV